MRQFGLVSVLLFVIASCGSGPAAAQGTARSLDIQPGARQNGLGAAGVALSADPADALWWNPAALGFATWHGVNYTRVELVPGLASDVIYQHVAAAGRVRDGLGLGASGTFLSYGESDLWYGSVEPTEHSGAVAAGLRVHTDVAFGVTAKWVEIELAGGQSGSALAMDLGGLYRKELGGATLGIGVALQNAGQEVEFGCSGSSPLSRNLKTGFAGTMPFAISPDGVEAGATIAFDYDHSLVTDEYDVFHYGGEFYAAFRRWARAAARVGYYDDRTGEIQDLTWGVGARFAGLAVDYAKIPQARDSGLPDVEKWTIGLHSDLLLEWLAAH